MAQQTVILGDTGQEMVDKLDNNFDELYAKAPSTLNDQLVSWTAGKNYEPLVITRDSEGRVTSMTVLWPDDSTGVYTATDYNATHEVYDGFTISHIVSGLTVTQAAVTRDVEGAISNKPALTVA